MTKSKLKTERDKAVSSLHRDINRLRERIEEYRRMNDDRKLQLTAYSKLMDKLLKEKRITKSEIKQFIQKRKELVNKK